MLFARASRRSLRVPSASTATATTHYHSHHYSRHRNIQTCSRTTNHNTTTSLHASRPNKNATTLSNTVRAFSSTTSDATPTADATPTTTTTTESSPVATEHEPSIAPHAVEPDDVNPAEMVDGTGGKRSHMVADTETTDSMKKTFSPEDDPNDKSLQWEGFPRTDMYKLLKHVDDAKKYGYMKYTNSYAQHGNTVNEADFPYLHHVQTTDREIANGSDDENQVGVRIAANREVRMNPKEIPSLEDWVEEHYTPAQKKEHAALIADTIKEIKTHQQESDRVAQLRRPPLQPPAAYKEMIWNTKDPRLDDLHPPGNVPYSYADWEDELRRDYMKRALDVTELPATAVRALDNRWREESKPSILSPGQELSQYVRLGDNLKPLKEYHQRMLRFYGAHYELGEPYTAPSGPLSNEASAGIMASMEQATEWTPDLAGLLTPITTSRSSSETNASDSSSDDDIAGEDEDLLMEDLDLNAGDNAEQMLASKNAQRLARMRIRDKAHLDKQNEAQIKEYTMLIDKLELAGKRDTDVMNADDVSNMIAESFVNNPNLAEDAEEEFHTDSDPEEDAFGNDIDPKLQMPKMATGLHALMLEHTNGGLLPDTDKLRSSPRTRKLDKYEKMMLDAIDPTGALEEAPDPLEGPRIMVVHEEVKEALFNLNRIDPAKYHSHELARMFGLSVVRTQAILRLEWMAKEIIDNPEKFNVDLETWSEAPAEEMDEFDPKLYQWDPEYFNSNMVVQGHSAYVDEGDLELLKRIEQGKVARYWKRRERAIEKEKAAYRDKKKLAYGAPDAALPDPINLREKPDRRKARHTVVLTDIAEQKSGNFRIAVRDTFGNLREPNENEFVRVRKRERSQYQYFHHKAYKVGERI